MRLLLAISIMCGVVVGIGCSASDSPDIGSVSDASADAAGDGGAAVTDAATDVTEAGDDEGYAPPIVTTPITGLAEDTWVWVPLAGAICRDGTATGIGVNLRASSPNLMIFLQGGGSCENAEHCAGTPLNYGATDFAKFAASSHAGSIFDRDLAANAVKDWNLVFVPYCTGDQHGGNNPGGYPVDYPTPQQYVGYVDMKLALARLAPTFPNVTKVLLSGESAGGAGVLHNYLQTAAVFSSAVVDALDDSAPPMPEPYLADCLQKSWATLWRFDRTSLADCGADCNSAAGTASALSLVMARRFTNSSFGYVEAAWDGNISRGYAFGNDDCALLTSDAGTPTRIPEATFGDGLQAVRTQLASQANVGLYVFPGEDHTSIQSGAYATRTTGDAGVPLTSFVSGVVDGHPTNAAP